MRRSARRIPAGVRAIKGRQRARQARLLELRAATATRWSDVRQGVEDTRDSLKQALERVAARFSR